MSKMTDEQKAWCDRLITVLNQGKADEMAYEDVVDRIQQAIETCPEP